MIRAILALLRLPALRAAWVDKTRTTVGPPLLAQQFILQHRGCGNDTTSE
jgi:hypothetical protein